MMLPTISTEHGWQPVHLIKRSEFGNVTLKRETGTVLHLGR